VRFERMECEVLVIGSGPGGATTACMLAEQGMDVILLEEGSNHSVDSAPSYSLAEMNQKYRNGGLTPALGRTKVTYIEGRCVGGASEINAALYHRPLATTLKEWQLRFQIDDFDPAGMDRWFDEVEAEIGVAPQPNGVGPASELLKKGARKLGWKTTEIQRFWQYQKQKDGTVQGRRRSMSETMIPRAVAAGCRLLPDSRVVRLQMDGPTARSATAIRQPVGGEATRLDLRFQHVFVCGGAVQTPALLRRSGLKQNIGDSLRMHPMIRIAARFDDAFNDPSWGVPVEQVEEFKPRMTLGCSHSSLPHIALWLAGEVEGKLDRLEQWQNIAVFYVAVTGTGTGSVRNLPGFTDPLVRYPLTDEDLAMLGEGLDKLGHLVFEAGAREIYSPVDGLAPVTHPRGLAQYRTGLPTRGVNVTTIHLFSSVPMGQDPRRCAADSWGQLHGVKNVWVNDSALLPDTPGVNPQGTVLAIARRNASHFLERRGA
jgi:choline dehydrogenase-like flavoprotein